MLKIAESTIVYVACPPSNSTGGTELLHQLVFHLNENLINAQIYYILDPKLKYDEKLIHNNFKKYTNTYVLEIEDNNNNILIVPEVLTELLYNYKNVKKAIWWLSVDNYYKGISWKSYIKSYLQFRKKFVFGNDKNKYFHFCQSNYAINFLKKKGIIEPVLLSDYLNDSFLDINFDKNIKQDIVLYNPNKGIDFTNLLKNNSSALTWIPIQNMSPFEVVELMKKAKIYIDFGEHPGKDRIPREAAMCGCCIITGKNGSAAFKEDLHILEEFKFERVDENIPEIINKLQVCFEHYNTEIDKFNDYRGIISNEKKMFFKQIDLIFKKNYSCI